jgi:hypothetical protein
MSKTLSINGQILIDEIVSSITTNISTEDLLVENEFSEITIQEITLAASTTDEVISLGGISSDASLVIIVPEYTTDSYPVPLNYLTTKINSSATATPFGKLYVAGGYSTTGIDAITISNADTNYSVNLKIYICKL